MSDATSPDLTIDPKTTALVLIDLQNAIVSRDVKPYPASEIMQQGRSLAEAFRAKGAPVIYVHVLIDNFLQLQIDEPLQLPKDLPPSMNDIADGAGMQPGDLLIAKRHWGAFAQTNLEQELRTRGVKTVVLAGIATNLGVESTLRQGTGLGFSFVTVEDACSTFTQEMQDFAFKVIFPRISKVRTTAQVLAAIG
ncbi:isochorismatase family protein [Acidipila sp. EB88]|uniref:isochorismatase family protein n=1 Tax=Acidipila sp. EB88 TaxID=2305226 RepID=UPI000F5F590D|nr:isochorismatase family protein [Acidipila sp. EB88]RRA47538.1 isochorismatase family protein [Acidipila sp. EB88]